MKGVFYQISLHKNHSEITSYWPAFGLKLNAIYSVCIYSDLIQIDNFIIMLNLIMLSFCIQIDNAFVELNV